MLAKYELKGSASIAERGLKPYLISNWYGQPS